MVQNGGRKMRQIEDRSRRALPIWSVADHDGRLCDMVRCFWCMCQELMCECCFAAVTVHKVSGLSGRQGVFLIFVVDIVS